MENELLVIIVPAVIQVAKIVGLVKFIPKDYRKLILPILAFGLGGLFGYGFSDESVTIMQILESAGYGGLGGLGVHNLGKHFGEALSKSTTKKLVSILFFFLFLQGCAGQTPQQQALIVCSAYDSALRVLAIRRATGKLSTEQIVQVDSARRILNPVCLAGSPELTTRGMLTTAEEAVLKLIELKKQTEGN